MRPSNIGPHKRKFLSHSPSLRVLHPRTNGVFASGAYGRPPDFFKTLADQCFILLRHRFFSPHNFLGHTHIALTDAVTFLRDHGGASIAQASDTDLMKALRLGDPLGIIGFEPTFSSLVYLREKRLAQKILKFLNGKKRQLTDAVAARIESATTPQGIALTDEQKAALRTAWVEPLSIILGGPGTGKTTIQRVLGELARDFGGGNFLDFAKEARILFLSPTGAAAQRQSSVSGFEAHTIQKILQPKPDSQGRLHNTRKLLSHPFIAVDEMSMVDVWLFDELLAACKPLQTRLVLFGDDQQLPSVGLGNVLGDMVESGVIPVVRLTKIKRQAEVSAICHLSAAIKDGSLMPLHTLAAADVSFVPTASRPETWVECILDRIACGLIDPKKDLILAYTNRTVGMLNEHIQARINPFHSSIPCVRIDRMAADGTNTFYELRVGDRVVQTRNNYRLHVTNGQLGVVTAINPNDSTHYLGVRFGVSTEIVFYTAEEANQLALGYALTVHKSQGSEEDRVNVILEPRMYRQLVYTAVTRAKKHLTLIGEEQLLVRAVADRPTRQTLLDQWLKKGAENIARMDEKKKNPEPSPTRRPIHNHRQGTLFDEPGAT